MSVLLREIPLFSGCRPELTKQLGASAIERKMRAGEVVLGLFDSEDPDQLREVMRGLWGAKTSAAIQQRMLELSRGPIGYDAIYYGLSTCQNKTRGVVERLVEAAAGVGADANSFDRALWGLQQGILEDDRAFLCDKLRELFEARSSLHLHLEILQCFSMYGSAADVEWLESLEDDERRPEAVRQAAAEALDRLAD